MTLSEGQRNNHVEDQLVMPCWYFEKEDLRNTPSIQDGIEYATEQRYRHEGAKFIINCGTKLGLRYDTCATGVVFFHRFYIFHSFKSFPRYVTAACCLFLAGKIEETPKKCRDIVKTARSFINEHHFNQFGQDPREEVMALERVLLKTIKFDLQADHPYRHLLQYGKKIHGDKNKIQQMVQMAWTFTNDSLCTTLCLQWEPEIVACALLYLATKLSRSEIEDWENKDRTPASQGQKWWEHFVPGMSLEVMEDICHQILDLYSNPLQGGSGGLGEGSGLPSGPGAAAAAVASSSDSSSRRKRKSESKGGALESVGTQAGAPRPPKTRATSSAASAAMAHAPSVTSFGGQPGLFPPGFPGAAGSGAPPSIPPGDASQFAAYAVFSRQQQAAAAAVAAVYAGSAPQAGTYPPPPPPPGGYGQPPPPSQHGFASGPGGLPISTTNPPVRIQGKPPATAANSAPPSVTAPTSSGGFNPAVRITRGQRR